MLNKSEAHRLPLMRFLSSAHPIKLNSGCQRIRFVPALPFMILFVFKFIAMHPLDEHVTGRNVLAPARVPGDCPVRQSDRVQPPEYGRIGARH